MKQQIKVVVKIVEENKLHLLAMANIFLKIILWKELVSSPNTAVGLIKPRSNKVFNRVLSSADKSRIELRNLRASDVDIIEK